MKRSAQKAPHTTGDRHRLALASSSDTTSFRVVKLMGWIAAPSLVAVEAAVDDDRWPPCIGMCATGQFYEHRSGSVDPCT